MAEHRRILLASEGPPFRKDVLAQVVALAREEDAEVSVLQLMRVWGTGLGLPHPGLLPNRQEKEAALDTVRKATAYLEKRKVTLVDHRITATRKPTKVILQQAETVGADLIVMGRPPAQGRVRELFWGNEPRRVARKARIPVHLVGPP